MATDEVVPSWEELIRNRTKDADFRSRTCKIFNRRTVPRNDSDKCCCGRLVRRHSYDGVCIIQDVNDVNYERLSSTQFKPVHSTSVHVNIFGRLKSNGCKFIRLDDQSEMSVVYNLLVDDCGQADRKPALILSVYGGAKYFTMAERLEKEIIRGIIDAATKADAWILTTGINNGVSKLVGDGISHYQLLREYPNQVKCIGLTKWGTINETMRLELKKLTEGYSSERLERQIPDNVQEAEETIEKNHTHCILLDGGQLNEYLGDPQRASLVTYACKQENHTCYGVTIIVEGGTGTLEVLTKDIEAQRPIVLIQGSGRLADTLASLIEQTSNAKQNQQSVPIDEDNIVEALNRFFPNPDELNIEEAIKQIQLLLDKKYRHLLNVFSLDRDINVAETIFKAIFTVNNKRSEIDKTKSKEDGGQNRKQQRRQDEDNLVDLALKWNYIEGVLPILKSREDAMKKEDQTFRENEIKRSKFLFKESLTRNRPAFVGYFLAAGTDPRILIGIQDKRERQTGLSKLYEDTHEQVNKNHAQCVEKLFGKPSGETVGKLDQKLNKFVGAFVGSMYSYENDRYGQRIAIDTRNHIPFCCKIPMKTEHQINETQSEYSKDELLRDLFLWSVFMDMSDMAKVFLIHLQSRICAALIASAIYKRYAKASTTADHKERFQNQALEFETYAGKFIDKCYEYNERLACELLLRQIPLYGNITCMQVAISSKSEKLVGTPCFDRTLSEVWYNKLSITNYRTYTKPKQLLALLTIGLLAPILSYRDEEIKKEDIMLSTEGINYYVKTKPPSNPAHKIYWSKLKYFHQSPIIKMCYHFMSYIGFLLAFSYMMLYHLDSPDIVPHWTEIYVIITVSTMLCEEGRKLYREYRTRMIERWGSTGSLLLTVLTNLFYIAPYLLFYLGLAFRYSGYTDEILTAARIIWAYDLELWYLGSLKFIIVLKSVGPKLFMLKNMLKDLTAFLYIMFIAIAAYGVVSRALILYKQVPFTGRGIFKEIFYEPYWFIYGDVSDKDLLDEKISNDTESLVAEATATHVLLAFHMLFINILILNLLIAVFTHTIDQVQENTEFYWRYQRYSFVREYFERPPLAYPPVIIIPHIVLAFLALRRHFCPQSCHNQVDNENHARQSTHWTRIFKMIPKNNTQQNEQWNEFENAATHSYARSILEKNKKTGVPRTDDIYSTSTMKIFKSGEIKSLTDQQEMTTNLNKEISAMKVDLSNNRQNIAEINQQMKDHVQEVNKSLQWIMKTMERVKMNDRNEPPPKLKILPIDEDAPISTQTTTSSV